jgi:hypothetical protein
MYASEKSIGQAGNSVPTQQEAGPLDLTRSAFNASAELAMRINRLADNLVGPVPQEAEEKANPQGPGILTGLAYDARCSLRVALTGHDAMTRLERAFGL